MVQAASTATLENLARLASKPGVQSTLILSKVDGSIIRSTGLLATPATTQPAFSEQVSNNGTAPNGNTDPAEYRGAGDSQLRTNSAEDVAKMVSAFVTGAKAFAEGMDPGDEVKLLRMRTKNNEIVIVPGGPSFTYANSHWL
ncbi:MAG: hypothetical protein Q9217_005517 [Psora testacea]